MNKLIKIRCPCGFCKKVKFVFSNRTLRHHIQKYGFHKSDGDSDDDIYMVEQKENESDSDLDVNLVDLVPNDVEEKNVSQSDSESSCDEPVEMGT